MFISFEGIEGSGKSTQIRRVSELLEKSRIKNIKTFEPGGTEVGAKLRNILLNSRSSITHYSELFLYAADRAEHIERIIIPSLNSGKVVLCDRFIDSTIVYQGFGRGIDLNLIKSLYSLKPFDIKPDLTFLLDLTPETGLKRIFRDVDSKIRSKDEMRFENEKIEFHRDVREGYINLSRDEPERIKVIDGDQDIEKITESIMEHINRFLRLEL